MEMVRQRKDGKLVEVLITMSPIKDVRGRMVGTSGIHRDIGIQKRAEDALRNSERKYRSLFEQASDAILIGDPGGRFLDCNQHACELLGYRREELLEKLILDVVAPETLETFPKRLSQLKDRDEVLNNENVFLRKDGSRIQAEVTAGLIDLEGEKCIMCLVRDVTERERTRAMMLRSEKLAAIGRMTAGTAHEILNPANIIGMHAQMLQDRGDDPATIQKSANSIYNNVKRIAKICDSLRRFSREEVSAVTRFDMVPLLKETISMVEPQTRIENITLSVDAPQGPLYMEADRDQILQVLLNLIGNARDAMPDGGRVTLSAGEFLHQGRDWVRLSVSDEGIGISEDRISKIFDPFYTTKGVDKGTGLGLSIVHGIVENLSGRIDVKSELNRGSDFVIELPADYSEESKIEKAVQN
jgi:PAS domain S-box-containing protein